MNQLNRVEAMLCASKQSKVTAATNKAASSSQQCRRNDSAETNRKQDDATTKTKAPPSWFQDVAAVTSTRELTKKGSNLEGNADATKPSKGTPSTLLNSSFLRREQRHSDPHINTSSFSPYPALEFPPLYFLVRHVPCLLQAIHSFYAFRWWVSYPLQRRVALSRQLHHLHIYMTYGELLLLLPYYIAVVACTLYTFVSPSVKVTGQLCRYTLIAALLFSQRNSFITLFLGIPVDRGIFYHKLAGRVAGVTGILHTAAYGLDPRFRSATQGSTYDLFANPINTSGTLMVMILVAMIISSIGPIRRQMFEVFYFLHLVFAAAFVVCTYFHSGWMVPSVAIATMGLDWFVRSIVMARWRYPKSAKITIMTETVVELTFPKTDKFQYNPGQYIYIAIPEISSFQWHPFSIVSSPNEDTVKLLIRKLGNWTTALHDLAKTKSEISFLLEGPYGNLSVDLLACDRKYRNVMLIGGGIGITPMESIYEHLVSEIHAGRQDIRRIKFVWVEREPTFVEQTEVILTEKAMQTSTSKLSTTDTSLTKSFSGECDIDDDDGSAGSIYIKEDNDNVLTSKEQLSLKLLNLASCGLTGDEDVYDSELEDLPEEKDIVFDLNCDIEEGNEDILNGDDILDLEIYLTSTKPKDRDIIFDPNRKNTRYGRPNISEIFLRMKRDVLVESFVSLSDGSDPTIDNTQIGQHHIAVCISAPRSLTNACRKACLLYSDENVKFDFHYETMMD
jgi:predicted ferric reductase